MPDDNKESGPTTHIDIEQVATAGMKGTTEKRALDWTYRPHSDWLFGELQGRSRFNTIDGILKEGKEKGAKEEEDAKHLAEGWLEETLKGEVVESYVDNDGKSWTGW